MAGLPRQKIFEILGSLEGKVSLYAEDLDSGETLVICPEEIHVACSLIKIPILALLLKDGEEGKVDIEAKIQIPEERRVGGTGMICHLSEGLELSWKDIMKLMIAVSDNTATNAIIDLLGMERINAFFGDIGLFSTELQRKMMDLDAVKAGRNNYTTAADMGKVLKMAASGTLVSRRASETVLEIMSRQFYTNKLPAMLPAVPSYASAAEKKNPPTGMVAVANKTGDLPKTQHDVGYFVLPGGRKYIIAMLTSNLSSDQEGISCIGKVSKAVYEGLSR